MLLPELKRTFNYALWHMVKVKSLNVIFLNLTESLSYTAMEIGYKNYEAIMTK